MKTDASEQQEGEQALASLLSRNIFRGRSSLYVHEVAKALQVSARHIVNLIVEGEIGARDTGSGKVTSQERYRVGVDDWDDFIRRRASSEALKRRKDSAADKSRQKGRQRK